MAFGITFADTVRAAVKAIRSPRSTGASSAKASEECGGSGGDFRAEGVGSGAREVATGGDSNDENHTAVLLEKDGKRSDVAAHHSTGVDASSDLKIRTGISAAPDAPDSASLTAAGKAADQHGTARDVAAAWTHIGSVEQPSNLPVSSPCEEDAHAQCFVADADAAAAGEHPAVTKSVAAPATRCWAADVDVPEDSVASEVGAHREDHDEVYDRRRSSSRHRRSRKPTPTRSESFSGVAASTPAASAEDPGAEARGVEGGQGAAEGETIDGEGPLYSCAPIASGVSSCEPPGFGGADRTAEALAAAASGSLAEAQKAAAEVLCNALALGFSQETTYTRRSRHSTLPRSVEGPWHPGTFIVDTTACLGKSAKDMYSIIAAHLGWLERVSDEVVPDDRPTIHCVVQTPHLLSRLKHLGPESWTSRYAGLHALCDKGNFARMVMSVQGLCDEDEFSFNPPTWALPEQLEALRAALQRDIHEAEGGKTTYIVKPEDRSHGSGIFLVQSVQELDFRMSTKSKKASVAQRYLDRPLLLGGFKFDLRIYVILIGGSSEKPAMVYLCKEGLARFCTEAYEEPNCANIRRSMAHLTNYSLNKRSENFAHNGTTMEEIFDLGSAASKRPLTTVLRQLEAQYKGFSTDRFYEGLGRLVRTTVAMMAPVLTSFWRTHGGRDGGPAPCSHILGFDVMLDKKFRPYLLEINNSPSLSLDEALPLDADDPRLVAESAGAVAGAGGSAAIAGGSPERAPAAERWRADGTVIRSREQIKDGRVCHCSDCPLPHIHRMSLVDLAVKAEVVSGLFLLLAQANRGAKRPKARAFFKVKVADHPLYTALQAAESLFARSGGAQKVFSSTMLRRILGPVCGHGRLEKHDLDAVSQRMRGTAYTSYERGIKSDQLRLFDFVDVLRQVGAVAFPQSPPLTAIVQVVDAAGGG